MGKVTESEHSKPVSVECGVMPLGMSKVPMGWPVMAQAYFDFAMWAVGNLDFVKAFETDTGIHFCPPQNGLDAMIDEATGATRSVISNFLDWLTVKHWGEA